MRLCVAISYRSPLTGGGVMSYAEARRLPVRHALALADELGDRGQREINRAAEFFVQLFGGRS